MNELSNNQLIDERLKYIFGLVNDWLKFAESKNAALLTANIAVILGLLLWLVDEKQCLNLMAIIILVVIFSLSISVLFCLLSFFPKLEIRWEGKQRISENDNLIYFGDVLKYTPKSYLIHLYKQVGEDLSEFDPYELDLSEQIVVNSSNVYRKFKLFECAIKLNIFAFLILTSIGAWIIWKIQ